MDRTSAARSVCRAGWPDRRGRFARDTQTALPFPRGCWRAVKSGSRREARRPVLRCASSPAGRLDGRFRRRVSETISGRHDGCHGAPVGRVFCGPILGRALRGGQRARTLLHFFVGGRGGPKPPLGTERLLRSAHTSMADMLESRATQRAEGERDTGRSRGNARESRGPYGVAQHPGKWNGFPKTPFRDLHRTWFKKTFHRNAVFHRVPRQVAALADRTTRDLQSFVSQAAESTTPSGKRRITRDFAARVHVGRLRGQRAKSVTWSEFSSASESNAGVDSSATSAARRAKEGPAARSVRRR